MVSWKGMQYNLSQVPGPLLYENDLHLPQFSDMSWLSPFGLASLTVCTEC